MSFGTFDRILITNYTITKDLNFDLGRGGDQTWGRQVTIFPSTI